MTKKLLTDVVKKLSFRPSLILLSAATTFAAVTTSFVLLFCKIHYQTEEISYSRLEHLLANKQWLEADRETAILYNKIVSRYLQQDLGIYGVVFLDFLGQTEISLYAGMLPCQNLNSIDRLWLKYSDDNFGFSVQAQIYNNLPSDLDISRKNKLFQKKINWHSNYWNARKHKNSNIDPVSDRGYLPSNLWMSYSPKPRNITKPLARYRRCIIS